MDRIDRRTFLRASLGTAGALAIASCSKSHKGVTGTGAATDVNKPAPRPTIRQSGSIDFGFPTPFGYFGGPGYTLATMVYDTLLQEDVDGKMLPLLAQTYDASADGLTHTFRLRDNIKWQDGQPLTADDVVFTIEYFKSQTLSPQLVATPEHVAGARALDPLTVEIKLDLPTITFAKQVAGQLPIAPRHIWASISDAAAAQSLDVMVGSGPYRLASHPVGEGTYLFNSFDGYFLGRPFVKRVEFRPVNDDFQGLQANEIDVGSTNVFGVPTSTLAPFRGSAYGIQEFKESITIPLKWNVGAGGALGDARFRQACARAINRGDIVKRVTGGNSTVGNPGYIVPDNEFAVPVEQYAFDPAAANRMLDDAGYPRTSPGGVRRGPDGKPLAYDLTVVTGISVVLELLVADLKNIGVNVNPVQVPLPNVLGGAPYDMLVGFDGGFGRGGDPDHLRLVYQSTSRAFQHPLGYRNPQVDDLADRQAVALDDASRKAIVADLQRLVAQDLPVLPLYYPTTYSVYKKSVFDQWSNGTALTDAKRNLMTGKLTGITIRPSIGA